MQAIISASMDEDCGDRCSETWMWVALVVATELEEGLFSNMEIPPSYFHVCSLLWKGKEGPSITF